MLHPQGLIAASYALLGVFNITKTSIFHQEGER